MFDRVCLICQAFLPWNAWNIYHTKLNHIQSVKCMLCCKVKENKIGDFISLSFVKSLSFNFYFWFQAIWLVNLEYLPPGLMCWGDFSRERVFPAINLAVSELLTIHQWFHILIIVNLHCIFLIWIDRTFRNKTVLVGKRKDFNILIWSRHCLQFSTEFLFIYKVPCTYIDWTILFIFRI